MTPEQFAYWLQGYFEIANPKELGESEIQVIKDHLATIFDKQTPDRSASKEHPQYGGITPLLEELPDGGWKKPPEPAKSPLDAPWGPVIC